MKTLQVGLGREWLGTAISTVPYSSFRASGSSAQKEAVDSHRSMPHLHAASSPQREHILSAEWRKLPLSSLPYLGQGPEANNFSL